MARIFKMFIQVCNYVLFLDILVLIFCDCLLEYNVFRDETLHVTLKYS